MHEKDKAKERKRIEKRHKDKLELIEDINENGGFYMGQFGLDQYFYYSFFNLRLMENKIICDVESIVIFDRPELHIERRVSTHKNLDQYAISIYNRIEEDQYLKLSEYLDQAAKVFFKGIKESKQK
jgi:hypothetical protein